MFLKKELLKYEENVKFLGITFDSQLTFETHIQDIAQRARKRLNLLKAIRGQKWGAKSEILLYTYRSFIRPLLEYSCILFAHASDKLLKKIQAIETEAIKIAFDLAPWTLNYWCYTMIDFMPILERLKLLSKQFLDKNVSEPLIKPLIDNAKPNMNGKHGPIYKTLNW